MKKVIAAMLMQLVLMQSGHSQKQVTTSNQMWFGYLNQTRLTNKWGIIADVGLRTKEKFVSGISQAIFRLGANYYLSENANLATGYAYFHYFPGDNHQYVSQPEHRIWQQVQWTTNYARLKLQQRGRLEERFRRKIINNNELGSGYNFNYRFRYNISLITPLGNKPYAANSLALVLSNEIHINFGKQIVYNTFDQIRFFTGFNYYITPSNFLQFGYMNILQQQPSGNLYKDYHIARIFLFHSLDMRRKATSISHLSLPLNTAIHS